MKKTTGIIPSSSTGLLAAVSAGCLSTLLAGAASGQGRDPDAFRRVFMDTLLPSAERAAGTALQNAAVGQEGDVRWSAFGGVVVTEHGAAPGTPGGAHHPIPEVAGTIRVEAEICATGSGFTGLALGRGDLSGNFWENLRILFYAHTGKCGLMVGGRDLSAKFSGAAKLAETTNRLEMLLDTAARSLTLRVNGALALDAEPLPESLRVNDIASAGFRFNEPVKAGVPFVRGWRVETCNTVTAGLVPVDLGMMFVLPGKTAELRWKAALRGPQDTVPYRVLGYGGEEEARGAAALDAAGEVVVRHAFSRGYHEVVFPDSGQTFGILALEPRTGPADPFFGIDSALSGLESRHDVRAGMVAAMKRSGIAVSRERLNQASVNPKTGVFNFDTGRHLESMRNLYREAGVKVLEMSWGLTQDFEPNFNYKQPQNLINAADCWTEIDKRFGDIWAAYEIGNEPDLDMPAMPADQYASTVKATVFGSDRVEPRQTVVGGVLATVPPGPYFDTLVANGMLECCDAFSFHQYDRAPSVQGQVQAYRDFLAANGKAAMPLWLTESGHHWTLGPDRPPVAEDAESASEISAKAVEARACGIATFFPFVMVFYEEGGSKSFSMFGREVTPLRSFAAYAWCIAALSDRGYAGDLRVEDAAVRRARVFSGADGACVATVYAGKPDAARRVRLPVAPLRVTGADGRALEMGADGSMPLPDGLGYAFFDPASLRGALLRDTPAARLLAANRKTPPVRAKAHPVAMQFPYSASLGPVSKRAYHLSKEKAAALPVEVRVQNMGDKPLTVTPSLHLPAPDSRVVPHPPVVLPPRSISKVSWTVDASGALDVCEVRHISITAECAEAPGILPLALPLLVDGELDEILSRFPRHSALPIAETGRWRIRSGNGKQTISSPDGRTMRADMTFENLGGAWFYPYFELPSTADLTAFSGVVLRARTMKKATNNMLILVEKGDRRDIRASDLFVADGQWHSVYVPFDQLRYFTPGMQNEPLRLDLVSHLSLGCVSREKTNTMEVSDLILVGPEAK